MGPVDQYTFCRLCLCTSDTLTDVFDESNRYGFLVKDTIEDLLQYEVKRVIGCPWLICATCLEKLNNFRLFKRHCIESKIAFESRFPQQFFSLPQTPRIGGSNVMKEPFVQPERVILMPFMHSAPLTNIYTFQPCLPVPFMCQPSTQPPDPLANCDGEDSQGINATELCTTVMHEANGNAVEPNGIVLTASGSGVDVKEKGAVDMDVSLSDMQLKAENGIDIEEIDVKYAITLEDSKETNDRCQAEGTSPMERREGGTSIAQTIKCEISDPGKEGNSNVIPIPMMREQVVTSCVIGKESIELKKHLHNVNDCNEEDKVCSTSSDVLRNPSSHSFALNANRVTVTVVKTVNSAVSQPVANDKVAIEHNGKMLGSAVGSALYPSCETVSDAHETFHTHLACASSDSVSTHADSILKKALLAKGQVPNSPVHESSIGHVEHLGSNGTVSHEQPYKCHICGKLFRWKSTWVRHHKHIHCNGATLHKCSLCPKSFKDRTGAQRHEANHYKVQQRFQCTECEAMFQRPTHFKNHMKSHSREPFPCSICGKLFKRKNLRKKHMMVHRQEKPYSCPQCAKSFSIKYSLTTHMLCHSNKKSFLCEICGKGFNRPQNLAYHRHLHSEVKRHSCTDCGAKFAQYSALWQHRKWHEGNKKFVCEMCSKGFVLRSQLRQHMKKHGVSLKDLDARNEANTEPSVEGTSTSSEATGTSGESTSTIGVEQFSMRVF